jgi:hypothetical protein
VIVHPGGEPGRERDEPAPNRIRSPQKDRVQAGVLFGLNADLERGIDEIVIGAKPAALDPAGQNVEVRDGNLLHPPADDPHDSCSFHLYVE